VSNLNPDPWYFILYSDRIHWLLLCIQKHI
jgi:hypothetical protein